jgi:hypothetical protein
MTGGLALGASATSRSAIVSWVSNTAIPPSRRARKTKSKAFCRGIGRSLSTVTFLVRMSCCGMTTLPVASTMNGTI